MNFNKEKIFELLPAIHRIRDAEGGGVLKALVDVLAAEAIHAEEDISRLYENWFIETCEEWVVPYIGDLLGVRNFHSITDSSVLSQRSYVANTLSYRRRKGIAPVLEQLALDVTGWRAHATEFFQLLATTQNMNHIRLHRTVTPDLRRMGELDLINSAFDTLAHTADVRRIASGRGRYNISNVGLFIWRLQSYPVTLSQARRTICNASPPSAKDFYFSFDPIGNDTQLFNRPETETRITHISTELNVPGLLRRRALYDELDQRRHAVLNDGEPDFGYFDDRLEDEAEPDTSRRPVFEIYSGQSNEPVPPEEILICNLQTCCKPPATQSCTKELADGKVTLVELPVTVAVDPQLGRFVFTDPAVQSARVSYSYGFSGDLGAGTFNRQASVSTFLKQAGIWQVGVSKYKTAVAMETIYNTLAAAVAAWNAMPAGTIGIISILDSASYEGSVEIQVPESSQLLITAAHWPERNDPDPTVNQKWRRRGDIVAADLRPHIFGDMTVTGTLANPDLKSGGQLMLNGLLIEGQLTLAAGNLGGLNIDYCTIVPAAGGINSSAPLQDITANQWLECAFRRSVCGSIQLQQLSLASLLIEDCILDAADGFALQAPHSAVQLTRTTFLGRVHVRNVNAENCIFYNTLTAERRQEGCVRFSFLPGKNPQAPRRFRCQPELEINTAIEKREKESGAMSPAQRTILSNSIYQWLVPAFTSLQFGDHGYGQLSFSCPQQIRTGADTGSEMGAFCFLQQPQRQSNLKVALDEYLPFGLEAGVIYVT